MSIRRAQNSTKVIAVLAAVAGGSLLAADYADARSGRGSSAGSRGSRTFNQAPATNTAPKAAQPIQKSMTQPGATAGAAAQAPRSSNMMRNLLLGGLIGAGLASLFGAGALANVLGFLLQGLLIAGIVFLGFMLVRRLRGGSPQPAMAEAAASRSARTQAPPQNAYRAAGAGLGASAPELTIGGDDYSAFERLLKQVQLGYTNGDVNALGELVTPEMLSNFARELDENKRRGLSNDLSEPKLLQGDLAESWSEASGDYATVDMRYEIIDALVDMKSGRVVEGSTSEPQEVVERWTFRRPVGGKASQWELSAIQQVA